jgi:hypothetical protein
LLQRRWLLVVFVATALTAGFVYWREADWWVYAYTGVGAIPKFKLTPIEQFVESAVVAIISGGVLTGVLSVVRSFWTTKGPPPPQ